MAAGGAQSPTHIAERSIPCEPLSAAYPGVVTARARPWSTAQPDILWANGFRPYGRSGQAGPFACAEYRLTSPSSLRKALTSMVRVARNSF